MGMIHYLAYQRLPGVKVQAICEQDPVRRGGDWRTIKGNFGPPGELMDLSGVAQYADLDAMLADPQLDLIDICLPTALHAPAAIQALAAGKHVLCEKPIALKPADGIAMVDAAEKAGRMLMIGHVLPFFPEYRFAYDAISSGQYGRIKGGHFKRIISDPLWMPRFYDPAVIGGPMLDLHVHDAHFIRLTCGHAADGAVCRQHAGRSGRAVPRPVPFRRSGVDGHRRQRRDCPARPAIHARLRDLPGKGDAALRLCRHRRRTGAGHARHRAHARRPGAASRTAGGDAITPFENELTEVVRAVQSGVPSPLLTGALARDAVVICQKETEAVIHRADGAVLTQALQGCLRILHIFP